MAEKLLPRVVIAGLGGESGKTLVTLALTAGARQRGWQVRAFKKGPDYIDAAWLSWASGRPARNLDTFMMGFEGVAASFRRHGSADSLHLIEGNRGLFDGADARGTHSTAELAKLLAAPVILVVNTSKRTRTAAACVLGCQKMDPAVKLAGVVLNPIASLRHEQTLREAIEAECGIPVLGAIPRIPAEELVPGRHLGLIPPAEYPRLGELHRTLTETVAAHLDLERLIEIACQAPPLPCPAEAPTPSRVAAGLRIAYLRDSAFTFYYPENLEALEAAGAELVPVSSLCASALPERIHALYIGGGFPETHAAALSANVVLLSDLRRRAAAGLPIYAECGGLMLLSRAIHWQGRRYPMADVLPVEVEVCARPQGHGYAVLRVEQDNPFYPVGLTLRGHEFHYSRIPPAGPSPPCVCGVLRGVGAWQGRDAVVLGSVWASYTHVHAAATPEWVSGLIGAARRFAGAGQGCSA